MAGEQEETKRFISCLLIPTPESGCRIQGSLVEVLPRRAPRGDALPTGGLGGWGEGQIPFQCLEVHRR